MSAPPNADGTRKWRVTVLISGSGSNLQALLDASLPSPSGPHSLSSPSPLPLPSLQITSVFSSRSDAFGLTRARTSLPSPIPAEAFPLLRWKKDRAARGLPEGSRSEWEQELAHKIRATKPDLVVLAGWMLILSPEFLSSLTRDWNEPEASYPFPPPSVLASLALPPSVDPTGTAVLTGLSTPGSSPYAPSLLNGPSFLKNQPIPIINLHPALPGQFPGAHAIQDAWDAFNTPSEAALRSSSTDAAQTLESLGGNEQDGAQEARRVTKTGLMIHRVIPLLDAGKPVVVKEVEFVEGEDVKGLENRIHAVEHRALVEAVGVVLQGEGDSKDAVREGGWWQE